MIAIGVLCTLTIGTIALWQARRTAHWFLVARILGRDVAIERAKRQAIAMAPEDLETGLKCSDATLCARAMNAARRVAEDESKETLVKLGFKLPERIK